MAQESTTEKAGGMAYEVILKPACTDVPMRLPSPPTKDRPLSHEGIIKKLKDADERRQSLELKKIEPILKTKERAILANKKVVELNDSFSKITETRLSEKLNSMEENRDQQMRALQERLKEHARRVEEVRKTTERQAEERKQRIENKMEKMTENREAQLKVVQDRIREHEKHIQKAILEVNESTSKFSQDTKEKLIQKMNITMKNREDQLKQLQDRLQVHEKHIEKVRRNKMEISDENVAPQ